jgi:hypothetical protein
LMTFCTPLFMLRQPSYLVLPVTKEENKLKISQGRVSFLGCQ